MDGGTLNPSMLMIIALQEGEYALQTCSHERAARKIQKNSRGA